MNEKSQVFGNFNNFVYNTKTWLIDPHSYINQINCILPYLYLSNRNIAYDLNLLKQYGITHLISVTTYQFSNSKIQEYHKNGIEYFSFPLEDVVQQSLLPTVDFIHLFLMNAKQIYDNSNINSNNFSKNNSRIVKIPNLSDFTISKFSQSNYQRLPKILVFCDMGISRSVSTIIYHLMKGYNCTFSQALQYVQQRRPIAKPNEGFCNQLQNLKH